MLEQPQNPEVAGGRLTASQAVDVPRLYRVATQHPESGRSSVRLERRDLAEIGHWATYEPDSADPGQGSTGWITQNQRASIRDLSICRDFAGQVIRWDEGEDPVSKWVWLPMLAVRDSGARRI